MFRAALFQTLRIIDLFTADTLTHHVAGKAQVELIPLTMAPFQQLVTRLVTPVFDKSA